MVTYPLPRGNDGKIIVGPLPAAPLFTSDDDPPAEAPASPAGEPTPPAGAPPARPRARSALDQQLNGPVGGSAPALQKDDWRLWLGAGCAIAIIGLAIWAILQTYQPAAQSPATAPSAAVVGSPAEAAPSPWAPATLARAIVVFDVPGGTPVGALEPGRTYTVLAERGEWRQLDVAGSGQVWARAWEMDGAPAPVEPTALPTIAPVAPAPRPAAPAQPVQSAPQVQAPAAPQPICREVIDADNGNRSLGQACGATLDEVYAESLRMLSEAPPPTLSGQ